MSIRHQDRDDDSPALSNGRPRATTALPAALIALLAVANPEVANANILWTLSDAKFNDGGSETGTFTTDNLGNLLTFDITTTSGTSLPGETYNSTMGGTILASTPDDFHLSSDDGTTTLADLFNTSLTLANSPVQFSDVEFTATAERDLTSGVATGIPALATPEPTSLTLLGAAFGLFLLTRRASRRDPRRDSDQPDRS